ncbi:uncharacterized protein K02A2.6-like, partial [Helicoverpa armigera]|uniref:uncharacterized protein K02A2.6-like n=1 Tax=Helicoverpa armigera TaxID=29058 RepID=UPI0030836A81
IPHSLREKIYGELHGSHFGVVKMKAIARERLWFPGIDAALERLAAACSVCAQLRPAPPRAPPSPWPYPPHAFYRIHLDFLGPFHNQMFLVIVDAFSKWVECYTVSTSYGSKTVISKLCDFMSRTGVPHTLVTDNGTSFTSREFVNFCNINGIQHVLSPAYHPSSNGQAESFVKIIKKGLKTIILQGNTKIPLQEKIAKFLFDYRNSKNSTTGKSPAEVLYGRPLRSRLDLINPLQVASTSTDLSLTVRKNQSLQSNHKGGRKRPKFKINEVVWIKRFLGNDKYCWVQGIIKEEIGNVMYSVYISELNCRVIRHIDQIRRFRAEDDDEVPNKTNDWHSDIETDDSSLLPQPEPTGASGETIVPVGPQSPTSAEEAHIGEREGTSVVPLASQSQSTPVHSRLMNLDPPAPPDTVESSEDVLEPDQQKQRSKRRVRPVK